MQEGKHISEKVLDLDDLNAFVCEAYRVHQQEQSRWAGKCQFAAQPKTHFFRCFKQGASALSLLPTTDYQEWIKLVETDIDRALRGDWYVIGGDLYRVMLKYRSSPESHVESTEQAHPDSVCVR